MYAGSKFLLSFVLSRLLTILPNLTAPQRHHFDFFGFSDSLKVVNAASIATGSVRSTTLFVSQPPPKLKAMRWIVLRHTLSTLISANMRSYTYESVCSASMAKAQLLKGRELAEQLNAKLKVKVSEWVELGHRSPRLICMLVGKDPASHVYVRNKIVAAQAVNIDAVTLTFDASITEEQLIQEIKKINEDNDVDGLLVQLPLPAGISEHKVCSAIAPHKDVDGFHPENIGRLVLDLPTLMPATPRGVLAILRGYNIETHGRNVVVVGRSKHVGMPLAMLLHSDKAHESGEGMDATVTICHRYTPREQLRLHCLNADIIISATGVAKLITADMVKPGATVIDVGIIRITDESGKTKICGDVDFEEVSKVAGAITPVPGGVGPMTISMLLHNTLQAARINASRINASLPTTNSSDSIK